MKEILIALPTPLVATLFLLAALLLVRAGHLAYPARRILNPPGDGVPEMVALMRGFRMFVLSALVAGVAAGSVLGSATVFWVVTAICAEELYESSMALEVMRRGFVSDGASPEEPSSWIPDEVWHGDVGGRDHRSYACTK